MIALIDYGMGNLLSVSKALECSGGNIEIVDKGSDLKHADAIVLPGVGNFGDGMEHLNDRGFTSAVKEAIAEGKPYLGICLGMQMLLEESEEAPGVAGLGVFKGKVVKFPNMGLKVPHMGWNDITINSSECSNNFNGINDKSYFYFVHSYYASPEDKSVTVATCEYGIEFTAAIGCGNVFATQFHPEKSQEKGLAILSNFISGISS
jgi:imidazole glycerol-phosphate synthase subunit HisH